MEARKDDEQLFEDEIVYVDPAPNIISFEQIMQENFVLPQLPPRYIKGEKLVKDVFAFRRKIAMMLGLPATTQKIKVIEELNLRYQDPYSFQRIQAFILQLGYCIKSEVPSTSPIIDFYEANDSFEQ